MRPEKFIQFVLVCIAIYFVAYLAFVRSRDKDSTTNKNSNRILPEDMMRMIQDIREQLKVHDKEMKQQNTWLEYQRHRQRLNILIDKMSPNNQTQMYRPHVLRDNVKIDCKKNYKFIVLVTSFAGNFERRDFIRKSWGNHSFWGEMTDEWEVIFNVGAVANGQQTVYKRLIDESNKYKDMLILDVPEGFYKLSQKVMAGLYWTYTKFQFKFIFKTDDDIFIHIKRLSKALNTKWASEDFVGNAMWVQPAERKGRYAVSLEEWPHEVYDPYCSGGGYFLSQSIIGRMIPHFNWETPLRIDDAYIGHLVKLAGGKKIKDEPEAFAMANLKCKYLKSFIVIHQVTGPKCREFVVAKINLELGRLKSHPVQSYTDLLTYKEALAKNMTVNKAKVTVKSTLLDKRNMSKGWYKWWYNQN